MRGCRFRYGKYNARKTEYNGVVYDSGREAQYAADLDLLLKSGQLARVDRQVPFVFEMFGKKICKYIIDFKLTAPGGNVVYVDVKGFKTPVFNLKWKMFLAWLAEHEPEASAMIQN